eukprot:Sspe_Gene.71825::Locus_42670_Transcript_1_1_Confidence_1.000_Length_775::g.71825::m.71825
MHREVSGNEGDWTTTPFVFNNEYFRALVDFEWTQRSGDRSLDVQYEERGQGGGKLVMLPIDVALKFHPQLFEVVRRFAADESLFRKYFAEGWKHITQLGVTSGGGVLHEAWEGSSGELITSGGLERMESQLGRDGYRERLRGYLHPPVGGTYHLWVAGDDQCKLFVEGTEVARVPGWTLKGEWGKYAEQRSGPLRLEAGRKVLRGGAARGVGWGRPRCCGVGLRGQHYPHRGPGVGLDVVVVQHERRGVRRCGVLHVR